MTGRSKDAKRSQFFTQKDLAMFVGKLINKSVDNDITVIDPCVGGGAIYQYIREPRIAADVDTSYFPKKLGDVETRDFLQTKRTDYGSGALAVCMNPPFKLGKKQTSGVVDFLNKCDEILNKGEIVVSIASQADRQESKIMQVKPTLHLVKEYIILKAQPFDDKVKNKTVPVNVCVQVWEKQGARQVRPKKYKRKDLNVPFDVKYEHHTWIDNVRFYIRNGPTSQKLLGEVIDKNALRMNNWFENNIVEKGRNKIKLKRVVNGKVVEKSGGTITQGKSGTIMAITTSEKNTNVNNIREKFEDLYKTGVFQDFMKYRKSGTNPSITINEIKRAYLGLLKPFAPSGLVVVDVPDNVLKNYTANETIRFPEDIVVEKRTMVKEQEAKEEVKAKKANAKEEVAVKAVKTRQLLKLKF